jgi:hypothetical protein
MWSNFCGKSLECQVFDDAACSRGLRYLVVIKQRYFHLTEEFW